MFRRALLLLIVIFLVSLPAYAQNSNLLAFVNSSGQLVVASADGVTRWIVTNPGERLNASLGYSWSPDGTRLFFAVDTGGGVSLRFGDVASMTVTEAAQESRQPLSGGTWIGNSVALAAGDFVGTLSPDGTINGTTGNNAVLISPFTHDRPNLPMARSVSSDGSALFYWQNNGYVVGGFALSGTNDPNARNSGLWADSAPVVAYWSFGDNGASQLSVTHAANGTTLSFNSGRSTPITPLVWRPNTLQLMYRADAYIRIADLACIASNCGSNPLENGLELIPASAEEVQTASGWLFYRDGETIYGLNLACVDSGGCAGLAIPLAGQGAPRTMLDVAGSTLVYTAYTSNPADPNTYEIRAVDLSCLNSGNCGARTLAQNAVAGTLSLDGQFAVVDIAGSGLNIINIANPAPVFLSNSSGGTLGSGLPSARWN